MITVASQLPSDRPAGVAHLLDPAAGSGVSWGAIFGGAAGAAALSLILLILGVGLGLSSVSPWSNQGVGAAALGISTIVWLTCTQIAASGMGGYLAGRLRTKWTATHADEVYFRDTAHGFLAWSVATLFTAAMLSSAIGSIVATTAQAGASIAGGAAATAAAGAGALAGDAKPSSDMGIGYWVDSLFRKSAAAAGAPAPAIESPQASAPSVEVGRILMNAIKSGSLPTEDAAYAAQLVAQRTGLSQAEAQQRVTETFSKVQSQLKAAETAARDAADKARKASAGVALWLFVSLLIGAFVASLAATFGGRRRDTTYL
ncbi:MAG: hypothetical protein ABI564_16340 [Ideonella sp.]